MLETSKNKIEKARPKFWSSNRVPTIALCFLFALGWFLATPFDAISSKGSTWYSAIGISLEQKINLITLLKVMLPQALGMMFVGWVLGWIGFRVSGSNDWLYKGYVVGCVVLMPIIALSVLASS